jgi:hypothetical protein
LSRAIPGLNPKEWEIVSGARLVATASPKPVQIARFMTSLEEMFEDGAIAADASRLLCRRALHAFYLPGHNPRGRQLGGLGPPLAAPSVPKRNRTKPNHQHCHHGNKASSTVEDLPCRDRQRGGAARRENDETNN